MCPSRSVITRPDEMERMMKVEPGQGIEAEVGLGLGAFKVPSATDSGGVAAVKSVELSSESRMGVGSTW